jgi:hypothetical protein
MQPGAPKKDLGAALGHFLWEGHQLQGRADVLLTVSNKQHMYWWLECKKHLRLLTCQGAMKQLQLPTSNGMLQRCERCSVGNYAKHGPDVVPDDKHRSIWEQLAWLAIECTLSEHIVSNHIIAANNASPIAELVGPQLGYVVEAKVLPGWQGCVDIYVPGLQLIIQVDGGHHDSDVHGQQQRDMRFLALAHKHRFHALRVSHLDDRSMHHDIKTMVHDCMACNGDAIISRLSPTHPLLLNPNYKAL